MIFFSTYAFVDFESLRKYKYGEWISMKVISLLVLVTEWLNIRYNFFFFILLVMNYNILVSSCGALKENQGGWCPRFDIKFYIKCTEWKHFPHFARIFIMEFLPYALVENSRFSPSLSKFPSAILKFQGSRNENPDIFLA